MELMNSCDKATPRNEHAGCDFSSVTEIITKVNKNRSPLSICNLHRLGKYQEQSRCPQPGSNKFNRAINVSILFSKTSALPPINGIITKVNENASPLSIHDLHRLGKYQEESRHPRPVLIKFKKAIDVRIYSPIQNKCP